MCFYLLFTKGFISKHANLNPDSLQVLTNSFVEPSVKGAEPGSRYQFERLGYFCIDADTTADRPVINRTLTLRDTWAKMQKKTSG